MDYDMKKEAGKQYLKYFRIWFIVLGVLAVIFFVKLGMEVVANMRPRGNNQAPTERVYDYADVLTDEEEQKLRERIADSERTYHIDLVLVTINENVESQGDWDTVMMNMADDFYDQNNYGYNKVHGDGVLLLDNWYEDENGSQMGSWLSTCGLVMNRMGNYEINRVLDEVYYRVEDNPYAAYKAYIDEVCDIMDGNDISLFSLPLTIFAPIVVALIYAFIHLKQSPAKDTVAANAYVAGGKPVMQERSDDFIRKNVVTRRIESSSSGGGGGSHHSGGGGSHRSSGGVSHGGGGRRR